MPEPSNDELLAEARRLLSERLREPAGAIRHAWTASPNEQLNVNATFPLVLAWITVDAGTAAGLVEAALDAQDERGSIPDRFGTGGPVPGAAQYRSPIKDLWMCGSSTHPGGGVMGAPGRNAAAEILRDLKKPLPMSDAYAVL